MTHPCPKCGRILQQDGEVSGNGVTYPMFQCDECVVEDKTFGEVALTFMLDENNKPFNPVFPDDQLPI